MNMNYFVVVVAADRCLLDGPTPVGRLQLSCGSSEAYTNMLRPPSRTTAAKAEINFLFPVNKKARASVQLHCQTPVSLLRLGQSDPEPFIS